jgi:hypothetical protein
MIGLQFPEGAGIFPNLVQRGIPEVKRPQCEADCLRPANAKVTDVWISFLYSPMHLSWSITSAQGQLCSVIIIV